MGGAWEWHQDYGYWYHNGCMLPAMASVMVVLDRATHENRCLQVLRGSHHAGRFDDPFDHPLKAYCLGVEATKPRAQRALRCQRCDLPLGPRACFETEQHRRRDAIECCKARAEPLISALSKGVIPRGTVRCVTQAAAANWCT